MYEESKGITANSKKDVDTAAIWTYMKDTLKAVVACSS